MQTPQKPPYYWIRKRGGLAALRERWGCTTVAVLALGATTAAILISSLPPLLRLGELLVVGLLWVWAARGLLDDPPPGMAPYFDAPIGDIHTYSHGQTLAQRCPEVDRIAADAGVTPVSAFGFADDFKGETLVWHDPADGLATFRTLQSRLAETEAPGSPLREDIDRIVDALEKAQGHGARFCLLLTASATNAQEHEQRKGSFF